MLNLKWSVVWVDLLEETAAGLTNQLQLVDINHKKQKPPFAPFFTRLKQTQTCHMVINWAIGKKKQELELLVKKKSCYHCTLKTSPAMRTPCTCYWHDYTAMTDLLACCYLLWLCICKGVGVEIELRNHTVGNQRGGTHHKAVAFAITRDPARVCVDIQFNKSFAMPLSSVKHLRE